MTGWIAFGVLAWLAGWWLNVRLARRARNRFTVVAVR